MFLPIDSVLPDLINALRLSPCLVLSAAPGAGKTTRVPLALLRSGVVSGRILMLEPRRLAAQRAAQFMAEQLGEKVGETVGYRIRGEVRTSARTQIEVVTEGILSRMIQSDPELAGVGLIIFDEFHERSLHADWGLALACDVQQLWREDLKLLVMSATLDGVAVSSLLGNAPVITSEGRQFPVDIFYSGRDSKMPIEQQVAQAVKQALAERRGDVLVFLPGAREINRTQQWLTALLQSEMDKHPVKIHALLGDSPPAQQQAALMPDRTGARKIILSTSIAETSLTINGVCVVVDAGLARTQQFDARRGMAGLVTVSVSQATAKQRAGRAGRQQAGACYRLWSEQTILAPFPVPEILQSDLMPLALELAVWGRQENELAFLDQPPVALLAQARDGLQKLGALTAAGSVTEHGRAMAELPTHPRIAHMLLRAKAHQLGALACDVAALLDERDLLRGENGRAEADLFLRWQALRQGHTANLSARERVKAQAGRLRQLIGVAPDSHHKGDKLGLMLALCYPERVARRRDLRGERWLLASGTGASLAPGDALGGSEWIAVADIDGAGRDARIYLAASLDAGDIQRFLPELYFEGDEVFWSTQEEAVIARHVSRFGAIIVKERVLLVQPEVASAALCDGLRRLGFAGLPLPENAQLWLARARWLSRSGLVEAWPCFEENTLLAELDNWLVPFLDGISKRSQLTQVDWLQALQTRLTYAMQKQMAEWAPTHIIVATGSKIALDYSGAVPVLAVRLQELFGQLQTPGIANGRVPVLLHLLSPARAPLAVTQDLASFWRNAYPDVRKAMRGQYPRHHWPENPLEAAPTRRTKAADDRARKNT